MHSGSVICFGWFLTLNLYCSGEAPVSWGGPCLRLQTGWCQHQQQAARRRWGGRTEEENSEFSIRSVKLCHYCKAAVGYNQLYVPVLQNTNTDLVHFSSPWLGHSGHFGGHFKFQHLASFWIDISFVLYAFNQLVIKITLYFFI